MTLHLSALTAHLNTELKDRDVRFASSNDGRTVNCVRQQDMRTIAMAIKNGNNWQVYSHENNGDILHVADCANMDVLFFHLETIVVSMTSFQENVWNRFPPNYQPGFREFPVEYLRELSLWADADSNGDEFESKIEIERGMFNNHDEVLVFARNLKELYEAQVGRPLEVWAIYPRHDDFKILG